MLIAAWAVEAEAIYLYLRDEYPAARKILLAEIAKVEAAGLARHTKVHLRRGAGAYICGEESAMLESIEGNRGYPRHRPPFVAQVGIFGRPTLVNNIETLYWVPGDPEARRRMVRRAGQERRQGPALLFRLGPREEAGRQARAGRHERARTGRAILRRHARWPRLQGLSAGRRLGRHPAGIDGRPAARFRQAGKAWLLRRIACGGHPLRPGRDEATWR